MAESKRKSGGAKTSRSETVTVRLDPRSRYLADLAARTQRRTLSGFIDWAVEEALKQVRLGEGTTVADAAPLLWELRPGDRLAKLAQLYPALLTYDEQRLIALIHKALAAAALGTHSAKQSGKQSDFVDENWDIFTRAIEEDMDPDLVMEVFLENPPTVANVERRIAKFQDIISNLERLKAELESAKKNG